MRRALFILAVVMAAPNLDQLLVAWRAEQGATVDVRAKAAAIRAPLFPEQRACTSDPAPQVAARCTRRSGKSSGWLREMIATAIETPHSRQIYLNETRIECEAVAWVGKERDGLLALNDDYELGGIPNETKLRLTFPNQASIQLIGADDLRAINRLRGRALRRVLVEEAQKAAHLEYAVKEVFQPAMLDYGGQIVLIGTPSKELAGLFYDVTRDDASVVGWKSHRWSVLDNPFFGKTTEERYARTLGHILALNGWTGDEPEFRREWLGEWVREDAYYVYEVHRVPEHLLYWDAPPLPPLDGPHVIPRRAELEPFLPKHPDGSAKEWLTVIGVDLGYMDPFAYHCWVFSHEDPNLYEIASWKRSGLSFDEQGAIMRTLADEWSPITMPTDAGGHAVKSAIKGWREGWLERKPLPVEEAHKTDKQTAIGWYNADLRHGKLKYRKGSHTLAEQKRLQWKVSVAGEILGENKATENHCSDGSLYAHRHARHYLHEAPADRPKPQSEEWYAEESRSIRERVREELREGSRSGYGRYL